MTVSLSVLDVLPVGSGGTARDALMGATELAQLAERHDYKRVWYAEHHGMPNIASTSPELLIAHVGPSTSRIRLGAGGVMLPNHVPLRVVEQYRTLEALHPGRIDLGIGRAAGTDPRTAEALRSAPGHNFSRLLGETLAFAQERAEFADDHPYKQIQVTPADVALPPMWMLGSSGGSAHLAGQVGFGYAFASHFSPTPPDGPIAAYRRAFEPSEAFPEPHVILAVHVLCAETEEEARHLALSPWSVLVRMATGARMGPVPTPEEVLASGFNPDTDLFGPMADLLMVGTPESLRPRLLALAERTGADELMVMTLTHAQAPRLRSYELLAAALNN